MLVAIDYFTKWVEAEPLAIVRLNFINHLVGFIPCQIRLYFSN